jgi:hypothetical protein
VCCRPHRVGEAASSYASVLHSGIYGAVRPTRGRSLNQAETSVEGVEARALGMPQSTLPSYDQRQPLQGYFAVHEGHRDPLSRLQFSCGADPTPYSRRRRECCNISNVGRSKGRVHDRTTRRAPHKVTTTGEHSDARSPGVQSAASSRSRLGVSAVPACGHGRYDRGVPGTGDLG